MIKKINKALKIVKKGLKTHKAEIELLKKCSGVILRFASLCSVNVFGFLIAIVGLYFFAQENLQKSKNARLINTIMLHQKLANFSATIIFSIAFWLNLKEIILHFNL